MRKPSPVLLAFLFILFVAACSRAGLEPRFVAVHNAMTAMGLAQTGPISQGSLPEDGEARFPITLNAGRCATVVALGSTRVLNLDVTIVDPAGQSIGSDATVDRQAAVQVCARQSGQHEVVLRMHSGYGAYTVSSWSGSISGGGGSTSGGMIAIGPGSCSDPATLDLGLPVQGSTQGAGNSLQGSCARGGAPERVYRFSLQEASAFTVDLESDYDGAIYVLRNCGDPSSEVACNDDAGSTSRSQISTRLEAGDYYLVVDGYGDASGSYSFTASAARMRPVAEVCNEASTLALGQPVTGSTIGGVNYFQATCADGAQSADNVYQFQVDQPSRFRARQTSDHDGALHLRSTCEEPTTELTCNDDHIDPSRSVITATLDPGTYYLFSDGFSTSNAGDYTLIANLAPASGTGAPGDTCNDRAIAPIDQPFEADTIYATNSFAGTCGGADAPDVSYRIDVQSPRALIRATVTESEFPVILYLQSRCGDQSSEVACVAPGGAAAAPPAFPQFPGGPAPSVPAAPTSSLEATVNRGEYVLVVDGQRGDVFGAAQVNVHIDDLAALERACRSAPVLSATRETRGTTLNNSDRFRATCAGSASSPDAVYRVQLARRSQVLITMDSEYDGALHLRRDCIDAQTELACNDDEPDNRHSRIDTTLDAGTYYLIVDGYSSANSGNYTIHMTVNRQ